MRLKVLVLLSLTFICFQFLSAQQKYTLSGYVKDAASGEDLIGATVIVPELETGTYTNEYGFFSITIPEGTYNIQVKYLSYSPFTQTVNLNEDRTVKFELEMKDLEMDTVLITGKAADENITSTEMSVVNLDVVQAKKLPQLFGEVDVIKNIQLLPGVQAVGEGISGYYVRGGNNDHNLILLDEATVYNASHVLGFFSVFNADALKSEVKLYKGGIPAQYGTRLASVLDLRMKDGNNKTFHGTGGIGLISSRLSLEGPIVKEKGSFIVSGRRTYADVFLKFSADEDRRNTQAYFYDLNAKANYDLGPKDRVYLSGYFGRDVFKFEDIFSNDWGNATGTLRWNHLFSDKLFSNTTLIVSDFNYGFEFGLGPGNRFEYRSGIRDYTAQMDFNLFANPKNQIRFGGVATLHQFNPGAFNPVGDSTAFIPVELDKEFALESGVYLSNKHQISNRLTLEYGLRYSVFGQLGPGEEYTYADDGETIIDTTNYSSGELIQFYGGLEPRFSARYITDEKSSLKFSYNRMRQYIHLASNATASFPWDIWLPSSRHIRPQIADQVAIGYFRNFNNNKIETSVELYYKYMQNQLDFKNGAQLILNPTIETELLRGSGWSYGAEFLIRKNFGKLTGWIGYTLSYTQRQIDGINDGNIYSAKNDRRHDVSVVATYEVSPRITLGGNWVYATGNAVTFPTGKTIQEGTVVPVFSDRNQNRMPDYHRMDLSFNYDFKKKNPKKEKKRRFENSLNVSLYNVYGRKNAFSIEFREKDDGSGDIEAVKTYLFRWVPSATWNFKF